LYITHQNSVTDYYYLNDVSIANTLTANYKNIPNRLVRSIIGTIRKREDFSSDSF